VKVLSFFRKIFKELYTKQPPVSEPIQIEATIPSQPEIVEPPKPKKTKPTPKLISVEQTVRSELNLEKNAVFTVSTYKPRSRTITTPENNTVITIGKMPDGTETGVLTTNHFKIYLALIELWEQSGKPTSNPIHFTTYRLIKQLGLKDSGGEVYDRLKKWLLDLRFIPITFTQSFYASPAKEYTSLAGITILNHLRLTERKNVGKEKRTRGYGEFRLDEYILQNLLANYVHPLRLDVITSFKEQKDLSILLYTYIDRNLAFKERYEVELKKLFTHLDLSQNYVKYPSDRDKVVRPVLAQLVNKPLSTGVLIYCATEKTKDGKDYKLVCRKKQSQTALNARTATPTRELPKERRKSQPEADEALVSQIKAHKADLTDEQRAELRQRALDKIRSNKNIKEDFITEPLIESFENELIKEEIL